MPRNVVSKKHAISASVKDTRDRFKRLLPRSIPNLDGYHLPLKLDPERAELYTNCYLMLLVESVVCHSLHETRLPNARITDNDEFEFMVMLLLLCFARHMIIWKLQYLAC